jgi:hypothetical protein
LAASEQEIIHDEVEKRAHDAAHGDNCRFIGKIATCWRRPENQIGQQG